jgi:hypothetical protein
MIRRVITDGGRTKHLAIGWASYLQRNQLLTREITSTYNAGNRKEKGGEERG